MRRKRTEVPGRLTLAGCLIAASAVCVAAWPAEQRMATGRSVPAPLAPHAAPAAAAEDREPWDGFAADVTIRQQIVDARGRPARMGAPPVSYRLERVRTAGRWRTVLTLRSMAPPRIEALTGVKQIDNPFEVARMEHDGDDGPLRLYDRRGRPVATPGEADRRAFGLPDTARNPRWRTQTRAARAFPPPNVWDEIVASAGATGRRRRAIEERFGAASGNVRGLDRFLVHRGEVSHELLVDRALAVPLEVNTIRRGALVSRTQLAYQPHQQVGHVRRALRSERAIDDEAGRRAVTDIEYAGIRIILRGADR